MTPIINIAGIPIELLDIITFLGITAFFVCVYFITLKSQERSEADRTILERRIRVIAKQQDDLLDSMADNGAASTFAKKSRAELNLSTGGHGVIDKIILLQKKAGITEMSLEGFIGFCFVTGVIFSIVIIEFNFLNIITGIPVGMVVGSYLGYTFLAMQAEKKKTAFLQNFPEAIEMMIRGIKAGLNIARIMKLVSLEAQEPVAGEFTIISQKFDLGVKPEQVLTEAADKINLEEFRFLVVAVILQIENGGMLGDILQNLADIVRKRLELNLKLKAMSAEARMSAIIISVLPFIFGGIMALVNPSHIQEFFKPGPGKTLLKIVIVLFCVGSFFMVKATKIKV